MPCVAIQHLLLPFPSTDALTFVNRSHITDAAVKTGLGAQYSFSERNRNWHLEVRGGFKFENSSWKSDTDEESQNKIY